MPYILQTQMTHRRVTREAYFLCVINSERVRLCLKEFVHSDNAIIGRDLGRIDNELVLKANAALLLLVLLLTHRASDLDLAALTKNPVHILGHCLESNASEPRLF